MTGRRERAVPFEPRVALASLSGQSDADWARAVSEHVGAAILGGIALDGPTREAARELVDRDRVEFLPPDPLTFLDDQLGRRAREVVLDRRAVHDEFTVLPAKCTRVGLGAIDLYVAPVDAAGQLGGVLALRLLRLERADTDTVLLVKNKSVYKYMVKRLLQCLPLFHAFFLLVVVHQGFTIERTLSTGRALNGNLVVRHPGIMFHRKVVRIGRTIQNLFQVEIGNRVLQFFLVHRPQCLEPPVRVLDDTFTR